MRGRSKQQTTLFSLRTPGDRVPAGHPLRRVKDMADAALAALSPTFDEMYSGTGRPSIPPEQLLKSCLLMAFYSVRSERLFCEQLDYNLLFRWFLDLGMEDASFDHSTFSQNRDRLLEHDVARRFFLAVMNQAQSAGLTSNEHFSVDGSLIEAWASLKSLRPKDEKDDKREPPDDKGNPTVNFHGQKRGNTTHASTTDPEARLARKGDGKEARLAYSLNGVMENRNGLLVDLAVMPADGFAERDAAVMMLEGLKSRNERSSVGADKGYDTADFVADCRRMGVTPHIAQTTDPRRRSAIDKRTTRPAGYAISQRARKRIEEVWGWMKTVGGFRKTRFKGRERTELAAYLVGAAYNLVRMARLAAA
ncbi:IS5 family transposase [Corallococcus exiguus]|uniref:IS5 family transposase n=1 Tax=Corallococcus exiguus TaxID=83462 RepID=UPI001560CC85|nr:IS5 family transposase [Corallococcus exiguus]NRD55078.1 IS5 family transposase [Corallococcus exiguus]NRD60425.1 IS5 family transposase [Corallococcus exiguus]